MDSFTARPMMARNKGGELALRPAAATNIAFTGYATRNS
jgi:hypothetical protein